MKKAWAHLALFTCGVLLAAPVHAAEPPPVEVGQPIVVRMDVVQLTDEAAQHMVGQTQIAGGFTAKGPGLKLLQSSELMTVTDKPALFHLGRKHPLSYFDPRATQFQIQYVDTGVKLDVKCKANSGDDFTLDTHCELTTIEAMQSGSPPGTAYPQTAIFSSQSDEPHVHFGDSVIVGRSHGPAARRYLESMGLHAPANSGDNLMMVVTLSRP